MSLIKHVVGADGAASLVPMDATEETAFETQRGPRQPIPRDVKAEAQRRIVALVGTSDLQSCIIKQLNMLMRATELANKRAMGTVLTAGETAEADALQAVADQIKAIRTKSNAIETLTPIPNDYADDARWA